MWEYFTFCCTKTQFWVLLARQNGEIFWYRWQEKILRLPLTPDKQNIFCVQRNKTQKVVSFTHVKWMNCLNCPCMYRGARVKWQGWQDSSRTQWQREYFILSSACQLVWPATWVWDQCPSLSGCALHETSGAFMHRTSCPATREVRQFYKQIIRCFQHF